MIVEPIIFASIAYLLAGLRTTWYAFSMTMMIAAMVMNVAAACGKCEMMNIQYEFYIRNIMR